MLLLSRRYQLSPLLEVSQIEDDLKLSGSTINQMLTTFDKYDIFFIHGITDIHGTSLQGDALSHN